MSKKHYILLARVIKSQVLEREGEQESYIVLKKLSQTLAQTLKLDNPRFDSEKFLKACLD